MVAPKITRDSKKAAFPKMLEKNRGMIMKTCQEMDNQTSMYYQ